MMTFVPLVLATLSISFPETSCDSWLKSMYGKLPFDDYTLVSRAARTLERRIEQVLWDESDGCYYDLNRTTGAFSKILTPASFVPLFIGSASRVRANRMIARQAPRLSPGWPSVSYDDPKYDPMGYWRGRTRLNVAYMALKGLRWYGANELSDRGKAEIIGWVRNDPGVIYENYNSKTGEPAGAPHFGWSSVFILSFELDWNTPRTEEVPVW